MKIETLCNRVLVVCENPTSTPDDLIRVLDALIKKLKKVDDKNFTATLPPPDETR